MRMNTSAALVAAGLAVCATTGALALRNADPAPENAQGAAPNARPQAQPDIGAMLIGGLKATPGCLGVDSGQFSSGKSAIFAWFENREAALRWYYSEPHKAAMGMFMPNHQSDQKPLEGIPEDYTGSILAIAAITFATPDEMRQNGRPFTQISIELYAPLKGGLSINGTLAPAGLKIPGADKE